MHELSLTRSIVAIVSERAGGQKVRRVTLEIGALTAVLPDAVRFCFDVCAADTVLAGAELVIEPVPGRGRCRGCGTEFALPDLAAPCPACGARGPDCLAGEELLVRSMELEVA